MTEAEFDERFRSIVPPEYRPALDTRAAIFGRAQGQISSRTMLARLALGMVRGWAEWNSENPRPAPRT